MGYDYERSHICRSTGLTGVEADHIIKRLIEQGIDPQAVDWEGAISDARDYGDRYEAVKRYLANYYGISVEKDDFYGEDQFAQDQLEYMAMDKSGVKDLLREYYKSDSKKRKKQIHDMLVQDSALHNVLMISLYDGADLPNARRFLNEEMKENILDVPETAPFTPKPPGIPTDLVVYSRSPGKFSDPRKRPKIRFKFNKRIPGNGGSKIPLLEDPIITLDSSQYKAYYTNGNGKKKPGSKIDIDQLMREIEMERQQQTISSTINDKKSLSKKEKTLLEITKQGFIKEGARWKKLLKKPTPKDPVAVLRQHIQELQLKNLPLQLQIQREQLLMKREQMQQLQQYFKARQRSSSIQQAFSLMGFQPQPAPGLLYRPGYFIEARPRLPVGFRYKKIPKGSRPKNIARSSKQMICKRCGVPKTMVFNMFQQPSFVCPICGAT